MPTDTQPLRRWPFVLAALIGLALVGSAFALARDLALARLADQAGAGAASRVQAVQSVLATQRAVTAILSDDGLVRAALAQPSDAAMAQVSRKLDRLRNETGSTVIYLLDRNGTALAASNWDQPVSFVGESYAFRSYFTEAVAEGTALQFALGTVSHAPGLYLSHDVRSGDAVTGVVVVKVTFDALEAGWAASPDRTEVTDAAGQVILSADPAARFAPPRPFGDAVVVTRAVPGAPGWTLTLATSAAPGWQAGLAAAGGMLGLLLLAAGGVQRLSQARRIAARQIADEIRQRAALERAVADRTADLTAEMAERRAAEARLAGMQADLVQANKLATLGQVTAGLAHEVNQPLATIRLLAENGLALLDPAPEETRGNLTRIVAMSDRIAQIMAHLRGFARKATGGLGPVDLAQAIDASVLLTESRRRVDGARLTVTGLTPGLRVQAEAVRLEQVLVNLIQNAQEALAGRPDPAIRLAVSASAGRVEIAVSDTGPGLVPEVAAQLFTPFLTSKPDGLGLGLVIAQGIARDFGGDLAADAPVAGQGATFRLTLLRHD